MVIISTSNLKETAKEQRVPGSEGWATGITLPLPSETILYSKDRISVLRNKSTSSSRYESPHTRRAKSCDVVSAWESRKISAACSKNRPKASVTREERSLPQPWMWSR